LLGGETLRGPLVISNYAVRARLAGAVAVARGAAYELWRPLATPRMALFAGGLYHDGWLAPAGHVTVWPARDGRVTGTLRFPLSLPAGTRRTVLHLTAPGLDRRVAVVPGKRRVMVVKVSHRGPWKLSFRSNRTAYLSAEDRPISVQAETPTFAGNYCGTAPPSSVA
jgi:hypothetical protein